jgi:hypothetical protein
MPVVRALRVRADWVRFPAPRQSYTNIMINVFWQWYEKNLKVNVAIASFLFAWQLLHLVWLTLDVVANNVLGFPLLKLDGIWESLIIIVDYTEIPALISVSLIYIHELRQGYSFKNILYLIFLNSQWLHLFWITDEFVVAQFTATHQTVLPLWLGWQLV